jgi:hypothetical protein
MIITREEKESLVLDLPNKCTPIREIATQASLSFRDIGVIKKKAEEEEEAKQGQAQQIFASTQAYKLFSEGKSPLQVAIALNIREPAVVKFYAEYWNLVQHHSLGRIYEEIKDGIGYFVRLYRLAKVTRIGVKKVVKVLEIANNDLPVVEHRCERSKRDLDSIEAEKQNSARLLQELSDQIATMRKTLDQYQLSYKEQRLELTMLQMQKVRLQKLVDNFQNNNGEYNKIRNTAEEKVVSLLSDKKMLLKLSLLSLTESMRKDPDRYSSLIYHYKPPTAASADHSSNQYYEIASYGQRQYPSQDCTAMILDEAEKLYNKLAKEIVNTTITDYASSILSSLPMLSQSDEKEQQPKPLLQSPLEGEQSCQTHVNRRQEDRFIQSSRIYNNDDKDDDDSNSNTRC